MTGSRRAAALGLVAVLGLAGCAPGAAGSGSQGSGPAEGSAARQEAAPKEEAEPVAEHDYETEWFYVDVPDDPSITYSVDGPFLWEAEGKYLPFIEFYQNGEPVASALCWEDGTPARSIYAYTAPE